MRSAHPRLFPIPQARSLSSLAFFFNYFPATARPLSRSSPPNLVFPPCPKPRRTSLPTPAKSSSGSGIRKCIRANLLAPSSPTDATCFSAATKATSIELRALRTPNLIPTPSFSLQLAKLARTTSMSRLIRITSGYTVATPDPNEPSACSRKCQIEHFSLSPVAQQYQAYANAECAPQTLSDTTGTISLIARLLLQLLPSHCWPLSRSSPQTSSFPPCPEQRRTSLPTPATSNPAGGSESDPIPKLLSAALKARKNDINVKTRLTVCEGREGAGFSNGDVLIFPEMIKYRDRRCGNCGPALIEKFKEAIKLWGLKDQVSVSACSFVGGHKYAGNLIIFSVDQEGDIAGHGYGHVTPDDVAELLEQHIGKGEIIQHLWRDGNLEVKETTEVQGRKGPGKLSSWMGNLEERDVLAAAALVGAVATIAVTYSFYQDKRKKKAPVPRRFSLSVHDSRTVVSAWLSGLIPNDVCLSA
ncbi:hypothetical protein Acr_00g0078510 [Actinidia rufa]|uniref:Sucrase/ferredoxin-like family protein n=1 Tax=Actinidia rufa TaxID=165716 RepID=A0A7J0DTI6_9ERIC|nr:hypothetical protein Acr_00g0078510 [Actinidia rufa]